MLKARCPKVHQESLPTQNVTIIMLQIQRGYVKKKLPFKTSLRDFPLTFFSILFMLSDNSHFYTQCLFGEMVSAVRFKPQKSVDFTYNFLDFVGFGL